MYSNRAFAKRLSWLLAVALILAAFGGMTPQIGAEDGGGKPPPPNYDPGDTLGDTTSGQSALPGGGTTTNDLSVIDLAYLSITALI